MSKNTDGRGSPATDQRQKELSISLSASSMINAADMIPEEVYQANLKRLQEIRETVRRLEMNNESAHKNYLVDHLEKRARDGRDAEIMLSRFRNQPGLSGTVQFINSVPSDKSEVVLPTTATLVEVPESHPSHSLAVPTTSSFPQTVHRGHPHQSQWTFPPQLQPDNTTVFRHHTPKSMVDQSPQHNSTSRSQAMNGQLYTTQNMPPQSRPLNPPAPQPGFQSTYVQQHSQIKGNYPPVIGLQTVNTTPVTGYYTAPSGWIRTEHPYSSVPGTGAFSTTYHDSGLPMQATVPRPPVTAHNQQQNFPSFVPTSRVPVQHHGVSASSAQVPSGQPPPLSFLPPAETHRRPDSTVASKAAAISKHYHHPSQPQQPLREAQQHPLQPHLQPPKLQPQILPQASLKSDTQELPSQLPQLPQTYLQAAPQSAGYMVPLGVAQSHSQPSHGSNFLSVNTSSGIPQTQSSQLPFVSEQARKRDAQSRAAQAAFIRLFQTAVQRGSSHLIAFLIQARASGISNEWFRAAINSLPRHVWESIMTQVNLGPTLAQSSTNASLQQHVSTIPDSGASAVSAQPPPLTATIPVQVSSAPQQATKPNISTENTTSPSATGQTPGSYAAHLQYYAEQAMKSTLSVPTSSTSITQPGSIPPEQKTALPPTRDVSRAHVQRTPKDSKRSTLARDILRSLGKIVPKSNQEVGNNGMSHGDGEPPEVNSTHSVCHIASPELPPVVSRATSLGSPSIPAKRNVQENVASNLLTTNVEATVNSRLKVDSAIDGPIMVDLTLEDSDESVHGEGHEPEATFLIQTFASTAISSQPLSPANTTNHTPLLENLSLEEEAPIDIAVGGDNADVPMCNPLLSSAAKENMESELLYPASGSTEPVSPSFEPLPREASEHALDGQLPLFLPSPPVSPNHTGPPETEIDMMIDEDKITPSVKRRSLSADEMEIDTEVPEPRVKKRRKQQVYVLVPPAPLYVKKTIKEHSMGKDIDLNSEGVVEDEEFQYSHLEQLLIEESKSRLLERHCRWLNCGAVLNCATNLHAHLKKHAREEDLQAPFLCRWDSCRRQFDLEQQRDVHLERHTIRPLPCPFAGCDERFNKPVEVMQHEVQHQKVERREPLMRKPAYQPFVPAIPARLGPPPHQLPSHRVIPRRVAKCRISTDRHAIMGPWILWNIFSPVELNTRKQNASMRGRPTRQATNYEMNGPDPRRDDYDFLLALSSYPAKNPQLDDLDSTQVTMSAAQGLTLWGSGSTVNSAVGSTTPEETPPVNTVPASAGEGETKEKSDKSYVLASTREDGRRESGQSVVMGEEDDVERMLIL